MKLDFFSHPKSARFPAINSQQLINLYPHFDQSARSQVTLHHVPGLSLFATTQVAEGRGLFSVNDLLYAVVGKNVYEIDSAGTATHIGTMGKATGRVSMDTNGLELAMVEGNAGFIYTFDTGAFAQITDADFPGADVIVYKDGYFAFNVPQTNRWMITGALAGSSVDALDFVSSEDSPDLVVSLLQNRSELWIFNATSTEVDYNSGEVEFPFAKINGATMDVGCAAAHSVLRTEGTVFWLGQDRDGQRHAYAASGYAPQPISDVYLDKVLRSATVVSDAFAYAYSQDGHKFYVLTLPTVGSTYAYDLDTKLWHQRSTTGIGRQRIAGHASCRGTDYVLDYSNGNVYVLDLATYTENGDLIRAEGISQHLHADGKNLFFEDLQIFMQSGVGLISGQGSDPQIMLQWSDDGGKTFGNEHWRSFGPLGEYRRRARWQRMGRARDRVYKFAITDPVPRVIVDTNLIAMPGQN
jgi:hypothetical protein